MKWIQKLVTNEYLVRMSYGLSEGLNRVSALGRGVRARRERNRAAVRAYLPEGFIVGQGRGGVASLPFGRRTMDYNGCEVIACYNALRLLGRPERLEDVSDAFERRGLFLGGLWGTHVAAVPRYFRSLGLEAAALYASRAEDAGAFDALLAGSRCAVLSFWNNGERLRSGVHTVAVAPRPGGIVVYNLYNDDTEPNAAFTSLADLLCRTSALPILLTALGKRA